MLGFYAAHFIYIFSIFFHTLLYDIHSLCIYIIYHIYFRCFFCCVKFMYPVTRLIMRIVRVWCGGRQGLGGPLRVNCTISCDDVRV